MPSWVAAVRMLLPSGTLVCWPLMDTVICFWAAAKASASAAVPGAAAAAAVDEPRRPPRRQTPAAEPSEPMRPPSCCQAAQAAPGRTGPMMPGSIARVELASVSGAIAGSLHASCACRREREIQNDDARGMA